MIRTMKDTDYNEIKAFLALAREGSYTRASQRLGVPKSYISRKVSELEARLQIRLVERTTRSVRLTDDGIRYFEVCDQAYREIEDAEQSFAKAQSEPKGVVRLTCPVEFGPYVARHLGKYFLNHYPQVRLELLATNAVMDLVKDQVDVAIRPRSLADPDMRAIHMGSIAWRIYAAKSWVHVNDLRSASPDCLKTADLIAFNPSLRVTKRWRFYVKSASHEVDFDYTPKLIASNLSVVLEAVKNGVGVATLPSFLVADDVSAGRIEPLFSKWICREEPIVAVYLNQKHMSSRTRALLDTLKELRF
jgi:DNA-binding transcriptional LysR family regulator